MPTDSIDKRWILDVEVNHGRLAMIAFIGILGQEYLVGVPASQFLRDIFRGDINHFLQLPEFPR